MQRKGVAGLLPAGLLLLGLLPVLLAGCVQIHRTIELNRDGSGKLTETVRFEEQLLAMARSSPKFRALTDFFKKERLQERMEFFGEVSLVSYETKEEDGTVCEATGVFAFEDINKVTIPAFPHRGTNWVRQKLQFRLQAPVVDSMHYYPGSAHVFFLPLEISFAPGSEAPRIKSDPQTHAEKEALRSALPVIRAMLRGLHASLKIRAFGAIGVGKTYTRTYTVFDVCAEDLDDDETLLKILEWNRYPDEHFTWNERIGRGKGMVMNSARRLPIHLEAMPSQMDPVHPLKKEKEGKKADK